MFQNFKQQMTPEEAEQRVKELLSSGKMSQEQFNNLKSIAQQYSSFFK
jgi:hypothetical protein